MRYEILAGICGEDGNDLPWSTRTITVEAPDELTACFNAGTAKCCYWANAEPVEVLAVRAEDMSPENARWNAVKPWQTEHLEGW